MRDASGIHRLHCLPPIKWTHASSFRSPQKHEEFASFAKLGFQPERPAHAFGCFFHNRKPNSRSFILLLRIHPSEDFEDLFLMFFRDADAIIFEFNAHHFPSTAPRMTTSGFLPGRTNFTALLKRFETICVRYASCPSTAGIGVITEMLARPE